MANTLYDYGRELFLSAQINWATDPIKCVLVDTGAGKYSFSAGHKWYDSVTPNGAVIAGPMPLVNTLLPGSPNLPVVNGAANADPVTFASVLGTLPSIEAIIIYKDSGVAGSSPLIAFIDTATGLPITPNGGDIIVTWDTGVNKIFRL